MKLKHSEQYRGHKIVVYEITGVTPVIGGNIPYTTEILYIDGNRIPDPTGPLGTTLAEDGKRLIDEFLEMGEA